MAKRTIKASFQNGEITGADLVPPKGGKANPKLAVDPKPAKYEPADGRITHATIARINIELGQKSVTLKLWGWAMSPDAVLALDEAERLHAKLGEAIAKLRGKAKPASDPVEDDPYGVG